MIEAEAVQKSVGRGESAAGPAIKKLRAAAIPSCIARHLASVTFNGAVDGAHSHWCP